MRAPISVAGAIAHVRAGVLTPLAEDVKLAKALGRVLAAPVLATRDQPPFDASAMDGYAVHRGSLKDGKTLKVVGESTAGRSYHGRVSAGEAVRIFTGAPIPDDCDAILIQENTKPVADGVDVVPYGFTIDKAHIRRRGQDFKPGDILLAAGARLDPWRLSLVAAAGLATVSVARRPRIAVLSTGDELVMPGENPNTDQIYESGSHAVMALIKQWGGKASYLGVKGDSEKAILKALKGVKADMIVTIGGASVGDYDLVKPALAKLGLKLDFDGVAVRPGKPSSFGNLANGTRVLGLPGNPASAFVVAQLLLKPWIEASLNLQPRDSVIQAALVKPLAANGPRETYLRAVLTCSDKGQMQVSAFDDQDSSLMSVFARANGLIRLDAGTKALKIGQIVDVLPLDRL